MIFKTRINPIIPLLRTILVLLFLALVVLIIYRVGQDILRDDFDFGKIFFGMIGLLVFGTISFLFARTLCVESIRLTVDKDQIVVENLFTRRTKVYKSAEIKGFVFSKAPYRLWNFKKIIIHLDNKNKIELMQFAYVDFEKIKESLVGNGYMLFDFGD